MSQHLNGNMVSSDTLVRLVVVTDRQTDHAASSLAIGYT